MQHYRDSSHVGTAIEFSSAPACIVSGGGVDDNNKWIAAKRKNDKFLFPEGAMKVAHGLLSCGLYAAT